MGRHIPMPVEKQGELIMLETTIHQRGEDLGVLMIRMGIMGILIEGLVVQNDIARDSAKEIDADIA